jgi:hypothetical protein
MIIDNPCCCVEYNFRLLVTFAPGGKLARFKAHPLPVIEAQAAALGLPHMSVQMPTVPNVLLDRDVTPVAIIIGLACVLCAASLTSKGLTTWRAMHQPSVGCLSSMVSKLL